MKDFKNYIIAILTGLLALSLFTQPAQSAKTKTYDEVKLAQYAACLSQTTKGSSPFNEIETWVQWCSNYKPSPESV